MKGIKLTFFGCFLITYAVSAQWSSSGDSNRGTHVYSSGGSLGYSIRTASGGGWAWQFVDLSNNSYFNVQYPTGNVGIGTTAPQSKLDVQAGPGTSALRLQGGLPYGTYYLDVVPFLQQNPWSVGYSFNVKSSNGTFNNIMSFIDGRVGVGTITPQTNFEVVGFGQILRNAGPAEYTTLRLYNDQNQALRGLEIDYSGSNYPASLLNAGPVGESAAITTTGAYPLSFGTSNTSRMTIASNGNVSIGTINPAGYKLAVAGKIISEEVVVKLIGSWPDYVFEKDYKLPSLEELQLFIAEHKHLPGVPTAKGVEENGLAVGEMNAILLKKIEELTLYVIDIKNENTELKRMIIHLNKVKGL